MFVESHGTDGTKKEFLYNRDNYNNNNNIYIYVYNFVPSVPSVPSDFFFLY